MARDQSVLINLDVNIGVSLEQNNFTIMILKH